MIQDYACEKCSNYIRAEVHEDFSCDVCGQKYTWDGVWYEDENDCGWDWYAVSTE